jgi:secreted PhoX family phosphatase
LPIARFISITDCDAEPTGVYVSPAGKSLFLNVQHRGGANPQDQTYAVRRLNEAIDQLTMGERLASGMPQPRTSRPSPPL